MNVKPFQSRKFSVHVSDEFDADLFTQQDDSILLCNFSGTGVYVKVHKADYLISEFEKLIDKYRFELNKDPDAHLYDKEIEAAKRLWRIAQSDTGQSGVVAMFLLGLYNGPRFPFDLTELRRLDSSLFDDCILVLTLEKFPIMEIHRRLGISSEQFDNLAERWGLPKYIFESESNRRGSGH
jgi:hypothetical protein